MNVERIKDLQTRTIQLLNKTRTKMSIFAEERKKVDDFLKQNREDERFLDEWEAFVKYFEEKTKEK
ncbi:MAG: hypothetical protein ACI4UE_00245 [Candidatus Scatovivens sp.]